MATAIGLFDRLQDAERAADALLNAGFVKDQIGVMAGDYADLVGTLASMGVPGDDAHIYAEGVSRGGALVTVQASPARQEEAQQILTAAGAVNVRERRTAWRSEATYPDAASPGTPRTESEELTPEPDMLPRDPLLDIEVDKFGT